MSDLFHKDIPMQFVDAVFETMEKADWHVFQVSTKRSSTMRRYVNARYGEGSAPPHIWLGVSVEDRRALIRLEHLRQARASIRFVSFEPLLEDLEEMDLSGFRSGNRRRRSPALVLVSVAGVDSINSGSMQVATCCILFQTVGWTDVQGPRKSSRWTSLVTVSEFENAQWAVALKPEQGGTATNDEKRS